MLHVKIFLTDGTTTTVDCAEFEARNKYDAHKYLIHGTVGKGIEGQPVHEPHNSKFDVLRALQGYQQAKPNPLIAKWLNEIAKG